MSTIKEKLKAISSALAAIEKQFGKGAIMSLGGEAEEVAVIPTGSVGLDLALGVGGLPRGRVVEIYGPESSGKTTLSLQAIAQAQKAGGVCAFIDAEHALDVTYARKLGVRVEDLLVSQPDCGEQALEIADKLVATGAIDLIVVDSVAALVPKAEIEGEMGDAHMGLQARLMSQALRKLTAATSRNNTCVMFINQLRTPASGLGRSPRPRARRAARCLSARHVLRAHHAPEPASAQSPPSSSCRRIPIVPAALQRSPPTRLSRPCVPPQYLLRPSRIRSAC
jgi:recombination protein RecA